MEEESDYTEEWYNWDGSSRSSSDDIMKDSNPLFWRAQECYQQYHDFLEENPYCTLSKEQRAVKDLALAAVVQSLDNLVYVPTIIQCSDRDVVSVICSRNGRGLQRVSPTLKNDKDVVLMACSGLGVAIEYASKELQNDKEVVMTACTENGMALKYASKELQNDKEVVTTACTEDGMALKYASPELQNNKEVVLKACSGDGYALKHASPELQNNKDIVLMACWKNGWALEFASQKLRSEKNIVMAAVVAKPEALKYALGGLNQDKDCLVMAGLWDQDHVDRRKDDCDSHQQTKKIVLSTRFSLAAKSSPHATRFTVELKKHPFIRDGNFVVYSPNAFGKGTCDPNWTDKSWPCRGTSDTCGKLGKFKTGVPQECTDWCWRYSFRHQLEEASRSGGFMIQVVDEDPVDFTHTTSPLDHRKNLTSYTLGDGQSIETGMALDEGIKVFRFYQPRNGYHHGGGKYHAEELDPLISQIQEWQEDECRDISLCTIKEKSCFSGIGLFP